MARRKRQSNDYWGRLGTDIGARLREDRERAGMSQAAAAAATGVPQQTICDYERGAGSTLAAIVYGDTLVREIGRAAAKGKGAP